REPRGEGGDSRARPGVRRSRPRARARVLPARRLRGGPAQARAALREGDDRLRAPRETTHAARGAASIRRGRCTPPRAQCSPPPHDAGGARRVAGEGPRTGPGDPARGGGHRPPPARLAYAAFASVPPGEPGPRSTTSAKFSRSIIVKFPVTLPVRSGRVGVQLGSFAKNELRSSCSRPMNTRPTM